MRVGVGREHGVALAAAPAGAAALGGAGLRAAPAGLPEAWCADGLAAEWEPDLAPVVGLALPWRRMPWAHRIRGGGPCLALGCGRGLVVAAPRAVQALDVAVGVHPGRGGGASVVGSVCEDVGAVGRGGVVRGGVGTRLLRRGRVLLARGGVLGGEARLLLARGLGVRFDELQRSAARTLPSCPCRSALTRSRRARRVPAGWPAPGRGLVW